MAYRHLTTSSKVNTYFRKCSLILAFLVLLNQVLVVAQTTEKKNYTEKEKRALGIFFVEDGKGAGCSTVGTSATTSNTDFAGREVLTKAQLDAIVQNQNIYQTAAGQVGIPWQMLAVIHLREHGLSRSNPSNGQGVYQFSSKQGGPYPTGPITEDEFMRQTVLAAEFIKNKAGSNYSANKNISAAASPAVVKDTFFSYNGRASVYEKQAEALRFPPDQGYEGSPYVMNKADENRDPQTNPSGWGQVKRDNGPIEYPANNDYGAFVMYAAIADIQVNCTAAVSSGSFVWPEPAPTTITSCFGPRIHPIKGTPSHHGGLDMSKGSGSPILAADNGRVTKAGPAGGYGPNYVIIEHSDGLETGYGHMSSMSVREGDEVTKGQQIGTEGTEGSSTASHLHFNVIVNGQGANPLQYMAVPSGVSNPKGCK